jgi:multicomponent Na+:H+ antiporter subunit C
MPSFLPFVAGAWILIVALYGMVTSRNLIHLIVCLAIAQSATYLLLLAIGFRTAATAPIFTDIPTDSPYVDPIVQALTLTDIVVAAVVTALLLALAVQIHKHTGSLDPQDLRLLRG